MHARVKDVMTTHVVAVRPDASYREMAALLRAHRVSGVPVVDAEGIVVGVVSETDLLARRAEAGRTAADLMTRPAVTTSPDELVSSTARLMHAVLNTRTAQSLLSLPELAMCLPVGTKVPSFYLLRALPNPMKQK